MKKSIIRSGIIGILIIFLLGLISTNLSAQAPVDSTEVLLKIAKKSQSGINCNVNLKKAFKIYNYLAAKGSPKAMNELAKMYRDGEGITQNYKYAIGFFTQASDLGNSFATCNLALMYHKGEGVKQNFAKAFILYDKAAQAGEPRGCYGAGYLTYKGFGVKQNYSKAVEYFNAGAAKGNPDCEYMLACYHLIGHDNKQNLDKGKEYLEKSMKHGHGWIEDITKFNVVDSLKQGALKDSKRWTDVKKGKINNNKRQFTNSASESDLQGNWVGKVYTYDWSGIKIEKEQDVKIKMSFQNQIMELQWFENNNLITTYMAENSGKQWKALKDKQFDKNSSNKWFIFRSRYDMVKTNKGETLYADFQKFSLITHEPSQPTIAVLERVNNDTSETPIAITRIFPNPFSNEIYTEFSIDSNQKISVEIYDIKGLKVYSGITNNYMKGSNAVTIKVNLPKGNYTLYVKGDNYSCSQNIIRK